MGRAHWRLVKWNGPEIAKRIRDAEVAAVQETIDAAAAQAAASRTGRHANITSEKATATASGVTGRWGVFDPPRGEPFHELFRETGTAFIAGDNAKRRAADAQYSRLSDRIRTRSGG